MNSGGKLRIQVVGPFRVCGADGKDRTPRGRKACALIAMLALSPEFKRTRVWLQDRLWGSRGAEQGAGSLRQSLSEIRRSLAGDQSVLVTDRYLLSLERSRFELDIDPSMTIAPERELLEGLDIGEDGFEDWLRLQRQAVNRAKPPPQLVAIDPLPQFTAASAPSGRPRIVLVSGERPHNAGGSPDADSLIDAIAKSISELGAADIFDCRTTQPHGAADRWTNPMALSLRSDIVEFPARQTLRLALLHLPSNALAWSSSLQFPAKEGIDLSDPRVMLCINQVANVAIDHFVRVCGKSSDRVAASALCHSGILHLFRLGKLNFDAADRLFASAFVAEQQGVFLAWRAYLRTFLLAERQFTCRQTIEAEALDFVYRALELDPHNSYVAALSAHVHTMMRRSYVAAYELAERSLQLNHANPIGWACLGIAKSYLGKAKEGFQDTLLARSIAGSAPFRYQLDALSSIAGTIAGDLGAAIDLAEASHALAPTFAPPLRYLSALYAHNGRYEQSAAMVEKLRTSEPDFSYDKLRDKGYPAAGLHRTSIIESLPRRQV